MCIRTRRQARSAFTLIELVTVMVILGIVAVAVGGPTLANIDSMRNRAAASRLLGDIRYAQRIALSSGLRSWVVFNAGADSYQLFMEDSANLGKANRLPVTSPMDQTSTGVQFGSGAFTNVAISSVSINSTSELEFDNFGVPYDGGGIALTATATISLSTGVSVTVQPVSGLVERAG